MKINGIEFPESILQAINDNKLVVFAGSGVSMNEPTNLPNFIKLAEKIAKRAGETFDKDSDAVDEFLGDLERKNKKVRKRVVDELNPENIKPNKFHEAILKIFKKPEQIRIVTTNQDEMFEASAAEHGIKLDIYNAPALPYGNEFKGLIHLHGRVSDPEHMVITDTEFGDAYMLNGYASKFLVDLIGTYTVLFIGYSYNDKIVRYLTSAIAAKKNHDAYILTDGENIKPFERTLLNIIRFDNGFEQECKAIEMLGEYCKRGLLDWKERLNFLCKGAPPIDRETQDEILNGIEDIEVQKRFCNVARGDEWPVWLDEKGLFKNIFNENAVLDEHDTCWSEWLSKNFISDVLLCLIEKHNNKINSKFCDLILQEFRVNDEEHNGELFATYLALFKNRTLSKCTLLSVVEYAEERSKIDIMWDFFWKMCRTNFVIRPGLMSVIDENVKELRFNTEGCLYSKLWEEKLSHHLNNPIKILSNAVTLIEELYLYSSGIEIGRRILNELDNLGIINKYYKGLESKELLYTLCEIMEKAFQLIKNTKKEHAVAWVKENIYNQCKLVKKISLHLLKDMDLPEEEKVEMTLKSCNLHDESLCPQAFRLLSSVYDVVGEDTRQRIIDKIWDKDINNSLQDEHKYSLRYNWLIWLKKSCKDVSLINEKLEVIEKCYPEFQPGPNPGDEGDSVSVAWNYEKTINADSLYNMSTQEAYELIVSYEDKPVFIKGSLLDAIGKVSSEHFEWCIDILSKMKETNSTDTDVLDSVLKGLENSVNSTAEFKKVVEIIENYHHTESVQNIAHFMKMCMQKKDIINNINDELEKKIINLANVLWEKKSQEKNIYDDWPSNALTTSTGIIVITMILLERVHSEELSDWFKEFIEQRVNEGINVEAAICTICGEMLFLFHRDSEWTRNHVIPYLSDYNETVKIAAWEGFVLWNKSFSVEFANEILPYFKSELDVKNKIEYRYEFVESYTNLLLGVADNLLEGYLKPFIKSASKEDREGFAHTVRIALENMGEESRKDVWTRWVREYWEDRNNNIPAPIESREYTEMLHWLLYLYDQEDAVDIAIKTEVNGVFINSFVQELKNSDFIKNSPVNCGKLIISIFEKSDGLCSDDLREVIEILCDNDIDGDLKKELLEIREKLEK